MPFVAWFWIKNGNKYAIEKMMIISKILVTSLVTILFSGCSEATFTKNTVIKNPARAIKLFFNSPVNFEMFSSIWETISTINFDTDSFASIYFETLSFN